MFGFLFGTMCLFGLFAVGRASFVHGRYGHGGGCGPYGGGRGGWHGRYRGGGRGGRYAGEGFARAAGEVFKRRLRIDEDQEAIVDHALIDLRKSLETFAGELKESRATLAEAFRGESVDDASLASVFTRHDDALSRARREVVSALKQVHAVLDADQRAQAADWIAAHDGRWV